VVWLHHWVVWHSAAATTAAAVAGSTGHAVAGADATTALAPVRGKVDSDDAAIKTNQPVSARKPDVRRGDGEMDLVLFIASIARRAASSSW
jgi:hypothetical protein